MLFEPYVCFHIRVTELPNKQLFPKRQSQLLGNSCSLD